MVLTKVESPTITHQNTHTPPLSCFLFTNGASCTPWVFQQDFDSDYNPVRHDPTIPLAVSISYKHHSDSSTLGPTHRLPIPERMTPHMTPAQPLPAPFPYPSRGPCSIECKQPGCLGSSGVDADWIWRVLSIRHNELVLWGLCHNCYNRENTGGKALPRP